MTTRKECENREQNYDHNGDPINGCNDGFDMFKKAWKAKFPNDRQTDHQLRDSFYDDFRHNNNQTVKDYLKEIGHDDAGTWKK